MSEDFINHLLISLDDGKTICFSYMGEIFLFRKEDEDFYVVSHQYKEMVPLVYNVSKNSAKDEIKKLSSSFYTLRIFNNENMPL